MLRFRVRDRVTFWVGLRFSLGLGLQFWGTVSFQVCDWVRQCRIRVRIRVYVKFMLGFVFLFGLESFGKSVRIKFNGLMFGFGLGFVFGLGC